MHTALLGTDYRQASLELLEKVHFNAQKIQEFQAKLPPGSPIKEWVIMATCNRSEIYYVCEDFDADTDWLKTFLADLFQVDRALLDKLMYQSHCEASVEHLFRVASGLESMVFGETEILGQVKMAYATAKEQKTPGPYLNKLFQKAVSVGKRVRDETAVSQGSFSVSSIAIDAMREYFGPKFLDQRILVLGSGVMSYRALKKLLALKHTKVSLSNRSEERGKALAHEFEVPWVPYSEFKDRLSEFDIVYVAVNAAKPVLVVEDFLDPRPALVVDVGVPRSVDPLLANLSRVKLVTIDELRRVADKNMVLRKSDVDKTQAIIREELKEFSDWYQYRKKQCLAEHSA